MPTKPKTCPGSWARPAQVIPKAVPPNRSRFNGVGRCPACGREISLDKYGLLRRHRTTAAGLPDQDDPSWRESQKRRAAMLIDSVFCEIASPVARKSSEQGKILRLPLRSRDRDDDRPEIDS